MPPFISHCALTAPMTAIQNNYSLSPQPSSRGKELGLKLSNKSEWEVLECLLSSRRPLLLIKLSILRRTSSRYQVLSVLDQNFVRNKQLSLSAGALYQRNLVQLLIRAAWVTTSCLGFFPIHSQTAFMDLLVKFTFNSLTSANMALCILFIALKSFLIQKENMNWIHKE